MMLSAAVMSHPSRARAADALLARLAPLEPSLAVDPDPDGPPSALAASLLAWSQVSAEATHHLVVQDDAELASDAVERIRSAIAARPTAVLVHYVGWASASAQLVRASGVLPRWGEIVDPYLPAVCVSMPAEFARAIARRPPTSALDDVNLQHALRERKCEVWAHYPSAADHGHLPSLVGNETQGSRGAISRGHEGSAHAEATTSAVRAFPVIDRRGGDGELMLRWLERADDGGWRVRSVDDALRTSGVDTVAVIRHAAARGLHVQRESGAVLPVRDLALLWLASWGTAEEARRAAQRARLPLDQGIARLNAEHAIAEWTGTQRAAWMTALVDDALHAVNGGSPAPASG